MEHKTQTRSMMASDLRLGNLVNKSLKSGNGRTLQSEIGCQDLVNIYENKGSFNYEPVPLTEEWLIRLGFKEYHRSEWNVKYDNDNMDFQIAFKANRIMCLYGGKFLRDVPFIHQLQNLVNSITGEELKTE